MQTAVSPPPLCINNLIRGPVVFSSPASQDNRNKMDQQIVNLYLPIAVLLGIGVFFALLLPVLSLILGPTRETDPLSRQLSPYESGMVAIGPAQRRLPVKFYRIAVLFILFDVDIILLIPWAITFRQMGYYGLWVMGIFMFIFILGDLWVWKKGVLEWE
jgi:NADH-quinone oxidoreductase subunit A